MVVLLISLSVIKIPCANVSVYFLDNIVLHESCPLIEGTLLKYIHRRARLRVVFTNGTKNELEKICFARSRLRQLGKRCLHFLQVHKSRARSGKI